MNSVKVQAPHPWDSGCGPEVRTVTATRYVTPLREGGSLPAIIEADDLGTYVLKFRGAGQGPKVLIAELLAGEIARALALPQPEIVFVQLDPALGRSEPDPEIAALIKASGGLNLALDYLPGSFAFDPAAGPQPDADLASAIVWFDAFITNVDRTARNSNLLVWHRNIWLIDNGAAFYFHYNWEDTLRRGQRRFPQVKDHVLLAQASALPEADARLSARLSSDLIECIVGLIPDDWLTGERVFSSVDDHRRAYVTHLLNRLRAPRTFLEDAIDARSRLV